MGTLVRTVGNGTNAASPSVKRSMGILSDGSFVMMVLDLNQTGVSGDGGDGTGVPKFYFYHSTDRTTWTLKTTLNTPAAFSGLIFASMTVDSANNIHLVYNWNSQTSIRYNKLTYAAGPTWTAGTDVVLASAAPSGYAQVSHVDIDTLGNDVNAVVVTAYWWNGTSGSRKSAVGAYVRTTAGSWVTHALDVAMSGTNQLGYTDDLTVAGDNKTAIGGDNIALFAYNVTRKASSGTDYGDKLVAVEVNVSTGARVGLYTVKTGHYAGMGGGFRKYWLFNNASNQFTLAGVVNTSPFQTSLYRFSFDRTANTSSSLIPASSGSSQGITLSRGSQNHNFVGVAYNSDADDFYYFGIYSGAVVVATTDYQTKTVNGNTVYSAYFRPGWQYWDSGYGNTAGYYNSSGQFVKPTVAPVEQVFSGASRNYTSSRMSVMAFHHRRDGGTPQSFRMEYWGVLMPLAPASVLPAASSTQSTDRPTLSADHKLQQYWAQLPTKMEWQIASDAGFTTNLRSIKEADADFILANGTASPYSRKVVNTEPTPAVSELTQGTWYIRARTWDTATNAGPWSTGQSFTVSHPPVGADLYPTAGAVFLYSGSGSVTFTWKFTDPSPYDSQTAYRIVVENADDGTSVVDSGKVLSTAPSATLTIPIGGKDVNLRWKLTLWDSDDVQGPDSNYQLFYTTDPPAPVITSPANAAVLTSATPQIQWDPGIGGSKEQAAYRVLVSQGSTLIYNSEWVISADTSHTLPVGYLVNNQSYTITVEVRDNLNLSGTGSITVTTDWIEPAAPDTGWEVYVQDYEKRGYVYITWTNANLDADFSAWNVYRRKQGTSAWEKIASYTSGTDRYAHRDYFAASGQTYEYTITQMVDRFGDLVESVVNKIVQVQPISDNYWIIDTVEPEKSIPLYSVTSDKFKEEYEQETYSIIGRGRHVDYGDRLGYVGSLGSQLRDKYTSGTAATNYLFNPAMSYQSVYGDVPDRWKVETLGSPGDVSYGYVEGQNPSPTGQTPYRLQALGMGGTTSDKIRFLQQLDGNDMPLALTVPGATVTLSAWIAPGLQVGKIYRLSLQWLDTAGNPISQSDSAAISSLSASAVDSYIPASSSDASRGNAYNQWYRLSFQTTVPTGTTVAGVRAKVTMEGDGSFATGDAQLIVSGIQLQAGSRTAYIDGDQIGAEWNGDAYLSSSATTGYYTARQQRQALERIKARKTKVYLRNPFGDIWLVAPGDIGVDRIAGVGKSEFVDVDIPYQEVSF